MSDTPRTQALLDELARFGYSTANDRVTSLCWELERENARLKAAMKIDRMVDRFLSWQLPKDFAPDGGVSFTPISHPSNPWPIGTNLLTAEQARSMIEHMLSGVDA